MGKKNKRGKNIDDVKKADYDKNVEERNIADECTTFMKIFGINKNIMRHFPIVHDGLKLVERRILYAMYYNKIGPKDSHLKLETIVGYVGNYHPHGGGSIIDSLSRMGKSWLNNIMIIDKHGNFGNVTGEDAGAARYIEARLSEFAYKCYFEEFSTTIVDMKRNYNGNLWEPEYLPAKYPMALINYTLGIGYGSFVGMPPYNFKDVMELTIQVLKNPKTPCILYPDSPTGCYIINDNNYKGISQTGKGTYRMRGVIDVNVEDNSLSIRNTPIQTSWADIKLKVLKILRDKDKKFNYLVRPPKDDTKGMDMCIKLFLKKEIDPYKMRELIYKKTDMQKSFGVDFKLIDDYMDYSFNVQSILQSWIDFRRETKRRIYNKKLSDCIEREHILKILLFILNNDNATKTMEIYNTSKNKKDIMERLITLYKISSLQADTIAEMKGHQFSRDAKDRYASELKTLEVKIAEYYDIIRSDKKIDSIIIAELEEGIKLFGTPRRSKIIKIAEDEDNVPDTKHTVIVTNNKNIKKLPHSTKSIGNIEQGDFPNQIIKCKNKDDLLVFDKLGNIYKIPVSELRDNTMQDSGTPLLMYRKVKSAPVAIRRKITKAELDKADGLLDVLMLTKNCKLKKTEMNEYAYIKNEMLGLNLKDNDELVDIEIITDDTDIIIFTNKGNGVRINSDEIKRTGRVSIGNNVMTPEDGEYALGMALVKPKDKFIFILTNKGKGKKCTLSNFTTMDRKAVPLKLITLDGGDDIITVRTIKGNNEVLKVNTKSDVHELNTTDIPELPRLSKGKKLVPVPKGDCIISAI